MPSVVFPPAPTPPGAPGKAPIKRPANVSAMLALLPAGQGWTMAKCKAALDAVDQTQGEGVAVALARRKLKVRVESL